MCSNYPILVLLDYIVPLHDLQHLLETIILLSHNHITLIWFGKANVTSCNQFLFSGWIKYGASSEEQEATCLPFS